MLTIRPLRSEDCATLAAAHLANLKSSFCETAADELLTLYYQAIASQKGAIGFVAIEDESFAGFVCGIWDREVLKRVILRNWGRLLLAATRYFLKVPRHTLALLLRFFKPHNTHSISVDGYELRPIVVLPQFRGRGVAHSLVYRLLTDAQHRGFHNVALLTESDNAAAVRFYESVGFHNEETIRASGHTLHLFRHSFEPKEPNRSNIRDE